MSRPLCLPWKGTLDKQREQLKSYGGDKLAAPTLHRLPGTDRNTQRQGWQPGDLDYSGERRQEWHGPAGGGRDVEPRTGQA